MIIPHSRPTLRPCDKELLCRALDSGNIADGEYVAQLEQQVSRYLGVGGAAAVSSGTSALHLSLLALRIGLGHEVIVPSYVCPALLYAVRYTGAECVLADIDERTCNLSLGSARSRMTNRTKAIIIPHMFGLPANVEQFRELGVPIIEDCAQAIGADYGGKKMGSFGDLAVLSLYATKMIAAGEGGVVAAASEDYLNTVRDLRSYNGKTGCHLRFNYNLSNLHAALAVSQLAQLDEFVAKRRRIAKTYDRDLCRCGVDLPNVVEPEGHVYYRYVIRLKSGLEEFKQRLRAKGIHCGHGVLEPLHRALQLPANDFPHTEAVYRSAVSIPIYPSLSDDQVQLISDSIRESLT